MPIFIIRPDLFYGKRIWAVLLICEEEERYTKDLRRREDSFLRAFRVSYAAFTFVVER
jgi:hypothetical protein